MWWYCAGVLVLNPIVLHVHSFHACRFQKLLRQMFSKLDVDGSGQLTVSQFERLFEDEDRDLRLDVRVCFVTN